jgi:hypothetical protein
MRLQLFIIITFLSFFSSSQETYVPDDNFEAYLESGGHGNGVLNDNYVNTASVAAMGMVFASNKSISDLTGIEDFSSLERLYCRNNLLTTLDLTHNLLLDILECNNNSLASIDLTQNAALTIVECQDNMLTSLDLTQCTALEAMVCFNNQLGSLDVSHNAFLTVLSCSYNELTFIDLTQNAHLDRFICQGNSLTTLDLSQNPLLTQFRCGHNFLTSLDLSQNSHLYEFQCHSNELVCLNLKNGNNVNMLGPLMYFNPYLYCIEVDDVSYANSAFGNYVDSFVSFSTSCSNPCYLAINEWDNSNPELIKIVDLLGRETVYMPNKVLVYIYSDGSTERVFRFD